GMLQDCHIISPPLVSTRNFEVIASSRRPGNTEASRPRLVSSDLCTIEGMTQRPYVHRAEIGKRPLVDLFSQGSLNDTEDEEKAEEKEDPRPDVTDSCDNVIGFDLK
ncbi:unnamed protein product, partial [Prorocentrum cordatum]